MALIRSTNDQSASLKLFQLLTLIIINYETLSYLNEESEPWQDEEEDRDDEGDDGAQDVEVVAAGFPDFTTAMHANLKKYSLI